MLEKFLNTALSEYGLLVAFLLITIKVLVLAVHILYKRNNELGDKFFEAMHNSTRVLSELSAYIKGLK